VLDESAAWDLPSVQVHEIVDARLRPTVAALSSAGGPVVLVTNEVGLGVVPAHRSGRLFRDLLGTVNQALGDACDEVHLVVAGRVLVL
jgi:adenosylcobinamide kinase/adenosylcobinamide-phosphate guanylyltransferase